MNSLAWLTSLGLALAMILAFFGWTRPDTVLDFVSALSFCR